MNLAVIDLEAHTKKLITNFKDRQATDPFWASNDRLLFRVDDDGMESFALYAVGRDGSDPVGLYFGTTSGELWMSRNEGERWTCIARHLPEIYAIEAAAI